MRMCARDTRLPSGDVVRKDEFVTALVGAANRDASVFREPCRFSLDRNADTGSPKNKYLLFGVQSGAKACWGKDRVALPILTECLKACARLQRLRRIPEAQPKVIAGIPVSLMTRFSRVIA
jgi:cytochrome P450